MAIPSWRIIPVSKCLVTPIYKPWTGHLEGESPQLGDLLPMVINQTAHSATATPEIRGRPHRGRKHRGKLPGPETQGVANPKKAQALASGTKVFFANRGTLAKKNHCGNLAIDRGVWMFFLQGSELDLQFPPVTWDPMILRDTIFGNNSPSVFLPTDADVVKTPLHQLSRFNSLTLMTHEAWNPDWFRFRDSYTGEILPECNWYSSISSPA